ncbi:hypothetical protein K1W69_17485 [Hoeflea sp. WL0058]|uniref:Uncharacterized protein n=1 Tax=Flavimaribacter sediminis TaxID=2865987 RepID=A0AAE3D2W7_9HYPH|nr:hypothetical protein [Flavimaribacter sediminis]MBW8638993.1 hypothetical protein [Flavimaribacter sediminis]
MISGRLTMRATVERNTATGNDPYGNPLPPVFEEIDASPLSCFVWSKTSRELVGDERTAMIEDMRAMFALSADIAEDDEISSVADRQDNEIIPGRLRVEGPVQRKHTHLEAALKRVS